MPAFGTVMTDRELAHLASYVAGRFGSAKADLTAEDVARLRKEGRH
jgi:mono/diheme cytochrome c family protein